ncbi:hypothetical protein [Methylobacterium trifolii]|uniref:Uncharacterized protein n=1 Tax=Methylobacterium trifolii TaxID=1003092 RepID=A0ABQ4U1X1_9HYPH|nr:hypothetical protein [Methylobacterium trifolii]GJE60852.1 hypothetical protein MPOCJGCO_2970 [Methylobacterium trifolii]
MDTNRLAVTEMDLASADRLWRTAMNRTLGPDAVLLHGFGPGGEGEPGSSIRRTFEARRTAVAAWRHARRAAA